MESPAFTQIEIVRQGPVTHVVLNRPAQRNAMSLTLVQELMTALRHAEADGQTRVLVLRGAGGHFCAGADLKDTGQAQAQSAALAPEHRGTAADPVVRFNAQFGHLCAAYASTGLATVALLEGSVMGGGFGLACAVDVALASETVVFRLPETSLGLLPAQIAPYLIERLGYAQAKRLSVTGGRLGATEALALGLVHEVCAAETLHTRLQGQLHDILQCAPQAIAATKALLAQARWVPPAQMIDAAAMAFAQAAHGPEGQEGVQAFAGKRRPAWAPETPVAPAAAKAGQP